MIIATFVKKEMEVGTTIVHLLLFGVDMEMENLFNHGKKENIELGNITEKRNGNESNKTKT